VADEPGVIAVSRAGKRLQVETFSKTCGAHPPVHRISFAHTLMWDRNRIEVRLKADI
jgi:hypothetical protein